MKNCLVLIAFMLSACAPANAPIQNSGSENSGAQNSGVVRFSDILSQYQNLNTRLENVAARLRLSSAALCPTTIRDGGFSVHTLADYPERLRPVAQTFLSIDDGLYIRSLRVESPAARAGMLLGDRIMGINNQHIPSGETQRAFYRLATKKAFSADKTNLTVARNTASNGALIISFELSPQTLCGYPAHVVFDEAINGHTDGEAIWITSALMRAITDDSALALIIAHEMAHAISADTPQTASRGSELKADRMALILMARAGFNVEDIERHWDSVDAAQRDTAWMQHHESSTTHPTRDQRRENFTQGLARIQAAQKSGQALDFSIFEN